MLKEQIKSLEWDLAETKKDKISEGKECRSGELVEDELKKQIKALESELVSSRMERVSLVESGQKSDLGGLGESQGEIERLVSRMEALELTLETS